MAGRNAVRRKLPLLILVVTAMVMALLTPAVGAGPDGPTLTLPGHDASIDGSLDGASSGSSSSSSSGSGSSGSDSDGLEFEGRGERFTADATTDVWALGDYDYVAVTAETAFHTFQIFDITDPTSPVRVSAWGCRRGLRPRCRRLD